ncbi:histidine phosphatase family protein [Luteibacter anthropi]|uniref:histidine phosphatase family protein n=1 Tax=Luteibacter anthropi TaxID=564369 RepID=UPI0020323228|nr:histidine phosphatase family protein [Luteibacter anthropi]URX61715.1 histidine phosphatase family protein [Luteibacter anthropi]
MKRLILIRHGHVDGLDPPMFRGRYELDLSGKGRAQLPELSAAMERWLPIGMVVSSPRRRAHETATAITMQWGGEPCVEAGLDDIDYGNWTGRAHADIARDEPEAWAAWQSIPGRFRFTGGESLLDVQARAVKATELLLTRMTEDQALLVVSHDSTIRVLLSYFAGQTLEGYRRWRVDPAGMTVIEFTHGAPSIVHVNQTSHLRSTEDTGVAQTKEIA